MSFIEPLESRTLLSALPAPADPGSTLSTALNLGAISGVRAAASSISPTDRTDLYRFAVKAKGNVNLGLSNLAADANLELLNGSGRVLRSSKAAGLRPERISLALNAGAYFVRITPATSTASTTYRLRIQADLNYGTVSLDGVRRPVALVNSDGSSRAINPKAVTWVLIHGWSSSPTDFTNAGLAAAMDSYSRTDQVLSLDWSRPAGEFSVVSAAEWVPAVARFAANTLGRWGVPASKINIVGHSLGGYLSAELAGDIPGGVNRLIALDPATLFPATFFDPVDFSENSQYSLAFIGSSFSTPDSAETADEAFRMNVGAYDSIISHMNVVNLFASMVEANASGDADNISRLFDLNTLSTSADRPWKTNAYSGGFEGTLAGRLTDAGWLPKTLTYTSASSGGRVILAP